MLPGPSDGLVPINDVAFSLEDAYLAIASDNPKLEIWQVSDGTLVKTIGQHAKPVLRVAFSLDGTKVATASSDTTAKVWYFTTGQALFTIPMHTKRVVGLAFDATGRRLATAGEDGCAFVRDIQTKQQELALPCRPLKPLNGVAFAPDGQFIAYAGSFDDVVVQPLTSEGLDLWAERRLTRSWTQAECKQYLNQPTCPPAYQLHAP